MSLHRGNCSNLGTDAVGKPRLLILVFLRAEGPEHEQQLLHMAHLQPTKPDHPGGHALSSSLHHPPRQHWTRAVAQGTVEIVSVSWAVVNRLRGGQDGRACRALAA